MKSDWDMIVRRIPTNDDVKVYPIADVHLGAAEHMEGQFEQWVDWIRSQPNAYVILAGDMIDNPTRSSVGSVFEIPMRPSEAKRRVVGLLTPIKDRILAAVMGNHEARSGRDSDTDPAYDIMAKMDLEDIYRPNLAVIKLQLGGDHSASGDKRPTYVIAVHHGAGGGALTGSAVNRAERFAYVFDGVDVLVVGHTHKRFDTTPIKIRVDSRNDRITHTPYLVASSGSWMSYGGYAAQKQLLPSASGREGQNIITLSGRGKGISLTTNL